VTNDPPAQSATPWFTNNGGATFTKGSTWQAAAPVMSMDGDLTGDGYYRLLVRYESGSGFNVGDLERN
jgi:hypothetical protein